MKRVFGICLVMVLTLVCFTGCMKMNMEVEIKEDGTASATSKMMIEEDAYNTLLSMDEEEGQPGTESDLDLKEFKKEVVDGKTYYSFEETVEFESYEALAQSMTKGDEDVSNLFSEMTVTKESNTYSFKATTAAMGEAEGSMGMGSSDWLSLTLRVKMPGKIIETTGTKIDDNTVEFALDDFSEMQTLSVVSKASFFGLREILLCGVIVLIIGGAIAFLVYRRKKGYSF